MRAGRKQTGFTIVELLIVIVVIGVLAAITVVAYNGVQSRARNAERVSDIRALQKALEIYYIDKGSYPKQGTVVGMDLADWAVTNLSVSRSTIINPGAPASTVNSISEAQYNNAMSVDSYGYRANNGSGACWSGSDTCIRYSLFYKLEGSSTAVEVQSAQGSGL